MLELYLSLNEIVFDIHERLVDRIGTEYIEFAFLMVIALITEIFIYFSYKQKVCQDRREEYTVNKHLAIRFPIGRITILDGDCEEDIKNF